MIKNKGFTIIEIAMVLAIIAIIVGLLINNRGVTEDRAEENLELFISKNNIDVKRSSCAGDSNDDGYGSCSIVTMDGEKIFLECPSSLSSDAFGASNCKEIPAYIRY